MQPRPARSPAARRSGRRGTPQAETVVRLDHQAPIEFSTCWRIPTNTSLHSKPGGSSCAHCSSPAAASRVPRTRAGEVGAGREPDLASRRARASLREASSSQASALLLGLPRRRGTSRRIAGANCPASSERSAEPALHSCGCRLSKAIAPAIQSDRAGRMESRGLGCPRAVRARRLSRRPALRRREFELIESGASGNRAISEGRSELNSVRLVPA